MVLARSSEICTESAGMDALGSVEVLMRGIFCESGSSVELDRGSKQVPLLVVESTKGDCKIETNPIFTTLPHYTYLFMYVYTGCKINVLTVSPMS